MAGRFYVQIEANGDVVPCAQYGAEFAPKNIVRDGLAEALRHYYRKVRGEHPDWAEYDAAMIADQRLLLAISIERAYGSLR